MADFDYDLFVIGGGSGGVRAARIAAQYGARVAIAEEYRYGGTCVIRGCVPKKLLVYAGRFAHEFDEAASFGWTLGERRFDWNRLISNKDSEIDRLEGVYRANLAKAGVEVFDTRAVLDDRHTVRLVSEDRTVRAETILVATGGAPNLDPALPGGEHVITSNEAFHLNELPKRVIVAGGGYVAAEFACIFNHLGADTTLIYRGPQILRGFDGDLRAAVSEGMARQGVKFVLANVFTKIEKTQDGLRGTVTDGRVLEADQIMFAIGRSPNTADMGLEEAGVRTDKSGAIVVDEYSQSSVPNIFAVGDVTNRVNLTPVAIREGHAFADTVFGGQPMKADHENIATAVFTTPEVGTVGLTEHEARERFPMLDIYKTSFRAMKSTLSKSENRVMMKVIVDADTDRVVGVHIAGEGAGEMIQCLGIAVKMGVTKADFDRTVAVHPTAAEELVTMRTPTERIYRDAAE